MLEIVIWTSKKFDFSKANNVLYESPATGLLHGFEINLKQTSLTDPDFLLEFEWEVVNAHIRPQCHVILIDGRDLKKVRPDFIQKVCTCVLAFSISQSMKYIVFYDTKCHFNEVDTTLMTSLIPYLELKSQNLAHYVKLTEFPDEPLCNRLLCNQELASVGMKKLSKDIINQVARLFHHDRPSPVGNLQISAI